MHSHTFLIFLCIESLDREPSNRNTFNHLAGQTFHSLHSLMYECKCFLYAPICTNMKMNKLLSSFINIFEESNFLLSIRLISILVDDLLKCDVKLLHLHIQQFKKSPYSAPTSSWFSFHPVPFDPYTNLVFFSP